MGVTIPKVEFLVGVIWPQDRSVGERGCGYVCAVSDLRQTLFGAPESLLGEVLS